MRTTMALAIAGLGLMASLANANGFPRSGGFGINNTTTAYWGARPNGGGGGGGGGVAPHQLGPWYLYWPHEAHFQTPALPQYPYWPTGQSLPPNMPLMGAPTMATLPVPVPGNGHGHGMSGFPMTYGHGNGHGFGHGGFGPGLYPAPSTYGGPPVMPLAK